MFGFLKDKLKTAVKKFTTAAEEEVQEEKVEKQKKKPVPETPVPVPKKEKVPAIQKKVPEKKVKESKKKDKPAVAEEQAKPKETAIKERSPVEKETEIKEIPPKEELPPEKPPEPVKEKEEQGFLSKIFGKKEAEKPEPPALVEEDKPAEGFLDKITSAVTKKTLSPEKFDELFWELEIALLENNVAVEVIEKIKTDLREELTTGKVSRFSIEETIANRLKQSVAELFNVETFGLLERIQQHKPCKICIIGVNGSGKTTTLAKLIHLLQKQKLSCVVAASDTFRAAAIDQLEAHTNKLGVKLISQGYNADPAAVAFDAIKHAEAQKLDVVLIDTAGRLHSNTNLMAELEKVVRVSKPDLKIFVGESITGNDCIEQAKVFDSLVGIDAIILSKADIDEKGGTAISVSYVTGKPILYLGTGQELEDLEPFDKEKIVAALEL